MFEAGFEYFISIMVTGAFLATLLKKTGFTDAQSGIITQVAAFSLVAQLLSVFVRKNKGVKPWLIGMHLINQTLFLLLYAVPFFDIPTAAKQIIFVIMYLGSYLIAQVISPYKLPWMMSFVDDGKRGVYTAIKEMTSLVGGMALSFTMGSVVDHYSALAESDPTGTVLGFGYDEFSLILCGATVFVSMILHTVSIAVMKERSPEEVDRMTPAREKQSLVAVLKKTFSNHALVKLIFIDIMWQSASGVATAFYSVYAITDLGFSLQFV